MRAAESAAPPADALSCDLPTGNASLRVAALPLAERDQLQTFLIEGPVAVRMEGCRLVPVKLCYARARASYTATPAETTLTLAREDDVLREVPAASERLTPIVREGRAIQITLLGAGRFDYQSKTLERHFDKKACEDATHIVTGYWVGALAIEEPDGKAIERSGDRTGCARASASPSAPPPGCSDLLTIDLAPLSMLTHPRPPRDSAGEEKERAGTRSPIVGGGAVKADQDAEGAVDEDEEKPVESSTACDPFDPFCNLDRRSSKP
jgi:hypothetical protein